MWHLQPRLLVHDAAALRYRDPRPPAAWPSAYNAVKTSRRAFVTTLLSDRATRFVTSSGRPPNRGIAFPKDRKNVDAGPRRRRAFGRASHVAVGTFVYSCDLAFRKDFSQAGG